MVLARMGKECRDLTGREETRRIKEIDVWKVPSEKGCSERGRAAARTGVVLS